MLVGNSTLNIWQIAGKAPKPDKIFLKQFRSQLPAGNTIALRMLYCYILHSKVLLTLDCATLEVFYFTTQQTAHYNWHRLLFWFLLQFHVSPEARYITVGYTCRPQIYFFLLCTVIESSRDFSFFFFHNKRKLWFFFHARRNWDDEDELMEMNEMSIILTMSVHFTAFILDSLTFPLCDSPVRIRGLFYWRKFYIESAMTKIGDTFLLI